MRASMICLWAATVAGCSAAPDQQLHPLPTTQGMYVPSAQQNSVHYYTQRIANQLFHTVAGLKPNAGIAIGTFTQIDSLQLNAVANHPLRLLGLQLEDGLMTASIGHGLKVIEYKTREKLTIKPDQDLMLSRDVSQLRAKQNVQYFLTGTMTEQQNGVVVNARLIDTSNNQVIAAATDYVPLDTFWQTNKVTLKNQSIYRSEY